MAEIEAGIFPDIVCPNPAFFCAYGSPGQRMDLTKNLSMKKRVMINMNLPEFLD